MKAFVDQSGKILCTGMQEQDFGGPWGQMQKADPPLAKWIDVPSGEKIEDCDVTFSGITVNPVKKAASAAKALLKSDRRARLLSANAMAGGLPELKQIVQDLIDEYKGE